MIGNTSDSWGWPARSFHWVLAIAILAQFGLGLWMEEIPRAERPFYVSVHASLGISILVLMALRLIWRLMNDVPADPPSMPAWQSRASQTMHWALYLVTFATIIAGWMLIGTHRSPVDIYLFGLVKMPQIMTPGSPLHEPLEEIHESLAFVLIGLIAVHVAAALYHHFVMRDTILARMTSGRGTTA